MTRYFIQQNDRGDLLYLDLGTKRPCYINARIGPSAVAKVKSGNYVPLYIEVPKPAKGEVLPTTKAQLDE